MSEKAEQLAAEKAAKDKKAPVAPEENKTLQAQIKELKRQNEEKDMKIMKLKTLPEVAPSNETQAIIEELQRQMSEIKNSQKTQQPIVVGGKKEKYRPVTPDDVGDDSVTFTARCVTKVIPGYMDENGMEVIAPHKIIVLNYAASDIRQDGKEQDILNFCSYSTKLVSEIEFLRSHPEYDQTFGENMNEVAGHDPKEYQFKTKAAEEVASMSPESVLAYADQLKIPNYRKKSIKSLKGLILRHLVEQFKKEADNLQDDLKKRLLAQAAKVNV